MLCLYKKKNKIKSYPNDLVGCIGKLPIYTEFIRYHLLLPELMNLDHWYQNAYRSFVSYYKKESNKIFKNMASHHFLYTATKNCFPMIGTLFASHDMSNRNYPFIIFRLIENPVAREFQSLIPMFYEDFFKNSSHFLSKSLTIHGLSKIFLEINKLKEYNTYISRRIGLEIVLQKLKQVTLSQYWKNLLPYNSEISFGRLAQTALSVMLKIKKCLRTSSCIGLRLPLSGGEFFLAGIVFWLQLLNTIVCNQQSFQQVFWHLPTENCSPSLMIFFKSLPFDFFLHLINYTYQSDCLFNVELLAHYDITPIIDSLQKEDFLSLTLLEVLDKLSDSKLLYILKD